MHELTATQNILEMALNQAAQVGAVGITKITLKIGEWSTFQPECIEYYFGIIAKGTPAEGAEFAVERIPVTYACQACGREYVPQGGPFFCPFCSNTGGKLVRGRELYVESIEVYHADSGRKESSCRQ